MNQREKRLLYVVGGLVGLFVIGFGGRTLMIQPLRNADKRNAGLQSKLNKLREEKRAYFTAEDRVKTYTQRSFGVTIDEASARSGEMLTQWILQSGLQETDFTRLPVGPTRIRPKGDNEIGWNIQGQGPLANVLHLLFLLQESPQIHRLEGLVVAVGDQPGRVKVRFKYLTLVVNPAPVVDPVELPVVTVQDPKRKLYDLIVARDILRPYIKRPPPPPPPKPAPPAPPTPPATPPPAGPGPEIFRIVSLSDWNGQPEVHVLNTQNQKTTAYKIGDTLADGTILLVDYRPLPFPGKAGLLSFSRVIIQIGDEYWAVERGQTLADKHKLTPEQLPQELSRL